MKPLYFLPIFLLLSAQLRAQTICNPNGNLLVYSNYDGGTLNISVDENIPNLYIGITTYEAVAIDLAGDRSAYLEVNRSGKVPALQAGDQVVTDTIAIIYWLAKRFPHAGLLPTDDSSLAASLSVMAWFGSVVHVLRRQYTRPAMFCDGA